MFFRPISTLVATAALCGYMTTIASSQEAKPGAGVPAANVPTGWYKICQTPKGSKEVCALNFNVIGEKGEALGQARVLEQTGSSQKGFTFAMPPGLLIQPGIRIQIDGAKTGTAKFQICSPTVCFADARFKNDFVSNLKRGNELKLIGISQAGKQVEFPITLTGFTAAYDGPSADPAALAKTAAPAAAAGQDTLQERLQRKADEARKKQLEKEKAAQ